MGFQFIRRSGSVGLMGSRWNWGVQGAALPPPTFVQLARLDGAFAGLSLPASPAGSIPVRPIKADERKEKTMTNIDFALLTTAIARLINALARFAKATRRR